MRISQLPEQNQQNGKQSWLLPLSFKIRLRDIFFHISIYPLRLDLSPKFFLNFLSNFDIPPCVGNFQIYAGHISRKRIASRHFYACPSPLKIRLQVLVITLYAEANYSFPKAAFSPNSRDGWSKLWFALSKFSQKIRRQLETLGFLYFVWLAIFSSVMALQFVNNIHHIAWYYVCV